MTQPSKGLVRLVTALAALAALLLATALPLGYYYFAHQRQAGQLDAETELHGYLITQAISRNPLLWRYDSHRLYDLLARAHDDAHEHHAELRRIVDPEGAIIGEQDDSAGGLAWPVLVRKRNLYDSGQVVGRFEIYRPLRPLLVDTGYVALFAALLGGSVFVCLRSLPLRALTRAMDRVSYLASHDALTGLPNRVLFRDRLGQALAHAGRDRQQAAILCLDLDHFKDVNDTLGHAAGDDLLRQVAERLASCLRRSDTLARLGGDEFAIIQGSIDQPEGAASLAQRLVARLAEPFSLDGHEVVVGSSIGIALCSPDGSDQPDLLLQNADLALYRAKAEGRGTWRFFEETMNARLRERKALEHDLRHALAAGQLELFYQPQVELASRRITGVEALLRWHHPERGHISPASFVPLAEETGLILPLGEWVLETACRQAAAWPELTMAVNLSPAQFRQADLAGMVARILRKTGLEPDRLELEITEGVLLHDTEATLATLAAIKRLGVRIAMDDFGTGYSSLGYLRRFPFDKIKIDRSFVADLGQDPNADAIVRAVVSLGRTLGMRANAEGVETREQAEILRAESCGEVQGFYFGRPMRAEALTRLLAQDASVVRQPALLPVG